MICSLIRTFAGRHDIRYICLYCCSIVLSVVIDTNQWYHATYSHPGEISITIGSEFDWGSNGVLSTKIGKTNMPYMDIYGEQHFLHISAYTRQTAYTRRTAFPARLCAPSEDSDHPAHLRSLIRIFAGTLWVVKVSKRRQADSEDFGQPARLWRICNLVVNALLRAIQ